MDKLQLLQVAKKMLLLGGGKENKNSDNMDRKHNHHKPKTIRTVRFIFLKEAQLFYNKAMAIDRWLLVCNALVLSRGL